MRACLWRELRSRKLAGYKFRRQQPIGRFIVDSVCLEKRVVIELDGGQHAEPSQSRYDAQRTNWLAKNNFLILRFWDHETLQQLAAVKEAILSPLKESFDTSSPSTGEDNLLPQGEKASEVQTGNIVYKTNRAHGLHAKEHWQGGTCQCLGSKPVPWINE